MTTLAQQLARFAASLGFHDLSSDVVHEAKRRVIDSLGCALGSFHETPVSIARQVASAVSASPGATILGTMRKTSEDLAAFAAGSMIRYYDFNDTYLALEPAHPSDNLAAALAVAEAQGASGADLITALVLAYEIQCRLCDAAALRPRGWDHVTYGAFSAGLAAAKLMGLDEAAMVHTLGLAGTPNIALRQTRVGELSMWKGCAFANASRNAVFAARLAAAGMTGPAPIFEGEKGFFNLVSGAFSFPPLGGPKHAFKILDTYIKYYPAEYHGQTAVEAALLLKAEIGDAPITAITVRTFDVAIEIIGRDPEKWKPKNRETADHSLPYLVAAALADGRLGLAQFSDDRLRDPKLAALVGKVRIEERPDYTSAYPAAMPNEVSVRLADGATLSREVKIPKGHPTRPLSDREVEEKFETLVAGRLQEAQSKKLLGALWGLEKARSLSEVIALCRIE